MSIDDSGKFFLTINDGEYELSKCVQKNLTVDKPCQGNDQSLILGGDETTLLEVYDSALKGDIRASTYLADMYYHGHIVKTNKALSIEIMKDVLAAGELPPIYYLFLARFYEGLGNFEESLKVYSSPQLQNYGPAIIRLAWMYRDGRGVRGSTEKCVQLLRQAANTGSLRARNAYAHHLIRNGNVFERIRALGIFIRNILPVIKIVRDDQYDGYIGGE